MVSPHNVTCNEPQFGTISAIDLRTRKLVWTRSIGSARDSGPVGIASRLPLRMGMPMFGGSLATKSGLVFIGATQERAFRAFDLQIGRASCRERVCEYVWISVVAVSYKKKKKTLR